MKQIMLPPDYPSFCVTDATARRHAQITEDRNKLTGAQNARIDALDARIDALAADLRSELEQLREILRTLVSRS